MLVYSTEEKPKWSCRIILPTSDVVKPIKEWAEPNLNPLFLNVLFRVSVDAVFFHDPTMSLESFSEFSYSYFDYAPLGMREIQILNKFAEMIYPLYCRIKHSRDLAGLGTIERLELADWVGYDMALEVQYRPNG